ncbi:MAG: hypothetical protein AB1331_05755 [Bacillota bacterium]
MAYNIHPVNREQVYLVPPSLRDWLPEDDLAWFIIAVSSGVLLWRSRPCERE